MSFNENKAHQANMVSYELTKQIAVAAAAGSASGIRAAELAFYRSARASAIANGISPVFASNALREMGVGGS
jgi:hypothetical protein